MKKLLPVAIALTFVGMSAIPLTTRGRNLDSATENQFVGAWRLLRLEEPDSEGKIHMADCTGLLVFTRDGHMSVQVMYQNPPSESKIAPVQYAQGGYEASYGTYQIEDAQTFIFHVEGALVRTLVGKDLKRVYELSGNQLIVKSPNQNERWRVAWQHYRPERNQL